MIYITFEDNSSTCWHVNTPFPFYSLSVKELQANGDELDLIRQVLSPNLITGKVVKWEGFVAYKLLQLIQERLENKGGYYIRERLSKSAKEI